MATNKITCGACIHGAIECCVFRSVGLSVGHCPLKHGYETRNGANFKFGDVGLLSITNQDFNVRYITEAWEGQRLELSIPLDVIKEHPDNTIKIVNYVIAMGNAITGEKVPKI